MASIVRGRGFAPNSIVTADELNLLVSQAQITGLGITDLGGGGLQWCSIYTAPASTTAGWLTYCCEMWALHSGPSGIDTSYLIRTSASGGTLANVALFNPYRIESRRLRYAAGAGTTYNAHMPAYWCDSNIHLGPLPLAFTSTGGYCARSRVLGSTLATCSTGITLAATHHPRIALKGLAPITLRYAPAAVLPQQTVAAVGTGYWQNPGLAPNSSDWSGADVVHALSMWNKSLAAPDYVTHFAWLFGGPMWRD